MGGALAALGLWAALASPAGTTETTERRGPFVLGEAPERAVMVEAIAEEAPGLPAGAWRRTLTRLRFLGSGGPLLYQETLATALVGGEGFGEEVSLGAIQEVRGPGARVLLVALETLPSAASGGTTLVVYGFDRSGRFRRLGPAFEGPGTRVRNATDASGRVVLLREGRYLDVASWTSHVSLVLPWQWSRVREAFELARLCGRVEAELRAPAGGLVRLHRRLGPVALGEPTPDVRALAPDRRVTVGARSRIEVLEGCRRYGEAPGRFSVWLRVRIDGEEGWVGDEEDLARLGLPAAD
jgi:hypothetical protein